MCMPCMQGGIPKASDPLAFEQKAALFASVDVGVFGKPIGATGRSLISKETAAVEEDSVLEGTGKGRRWSAAVAGGIGKVQRLLSHATASRRRSLAAKAAAMDDKDLPAHMRAESYRVEDNVATVGGRLGWPGEKRGDGVGIG